MTSSARIAGIGAYLPKQVVTSEELAARHGVTAEWIEDRCGIQQRHYAAEGEATSDLAAHAVRDAAADAGWKLSDIDCIIVATLSPDAMFPGSGVYLQAKLGLGHIAVVDVRNQCSGFAYALVIANALVFCGMYRRIMVVGAEVHSHCLADDRISKEIAVLFGDGGAAVAIEWHAAPLLQAASLHVDGSGADSLKLQLFNPAGRPWMSADQLAQGSHLPVMNGKRVFIRAVTELVNLAEMLLSQASMTMEDVDLVLPHQANLRIIEAVQKRLKLPGAKIFSNIQTHGNTTAASIPLAMKGAIAAGKLRRGQRVMILAFGSGFTWGGCILNY